MRKENLYHVLEEILTATDTPLSLHDLWQYERVRQYAKDVYRVSDYLGALWRKERVVRYPAARKVGETPQYAYVWKKSPTGPAKPVVEQSIRYPASVRVTYKPNGDIQMEITVDIPHKAG